MQKWMCLIGLLLNIVFNGSFWSHFLLLGSRDAWALLHPFLYFTNFSISSRMWKRKCKCSEHMEWRDGLGKALQDKRPDQSTSNGPISVFVASFISDAAVGDTSEADPLSQGHDFSLFVVFSLEKHHGQLANLPHKIASLVLFSATKSNTGDFLVKEIRILMAPPLTWDHGEQNFFKKGSFYLIFLRKGKGK